MRIAIFLLAALILAVIPVMAQEINETQLNETLTQIEAETGGIGPDNPLYIFDTAFDKLKLWLTWDPEAKARLAIKIAEERLMEAKEMAKKNKTKEAEIAVAGYEEMLNETERALEAIPEDGSAEISEGAAKKVAGIQAELQNLTLKALVVIQHVSQKVIAKAPEEAKPALQRAFERVTQHLEAVQQKMQEKRERIKLKLKAVLNLTTEEAENLTQQIEAETGLKKAKEKVEKIRKKIRNISQPEIPENLTQPQIPENITQPEIHQPEIPKGPKAGKAL